MYIYILHTLVIFFFTLIKHKKFCFPMTFQKTINVSIGIMTSLVLLLSIANVLTGFRNQCINGDPDYQDSKTSDCKNSTCPGELDAEGPNPVRTARDLQKFNLMTAFASGGVAIGIIYMLFKGGHENTKITLSIVMAVVLAVQSGLTLGAQSKYNDCQKTDTNFLLPDQTWGIIGASVSGVVLLSSIGFAIKSGKAQDAYSNIQARLQGYNPVKDNEEFLKSMTSNNFLDF